MAKQRSSRRARGDGSVTSRIRSGKVTWSIQWYEPKFPGATTKRRRTRGGFTTEQKARSALRAILVELDRGNLSPTSGHLTLGSYLDRWVDEIRVSEPTRAHYKRYIRLHVRPYIGDLRLDYLEPTDLAKLYRTLERSGNKSTNKRVATGLKAASVIKVHQVLSTALEDAIEEGLIGSNPAKKRSARPPTVAQVKEQKPQIKVWDKDTLQLFHAWTREDQFDRYHLLWMVAIYTGMRRGELCALTWADIDLHSGLISVNKSIGEVKELGKRTVQYVKSTKNTDSRNVTISPDLRRALSLEKERHIRKFGSSGINNRAVFITSRGGTPFKLNYISERWIYLVNQFAQEHPGRDIPILRLHDLRHTHATHLLAMGTHTKDAQYRLGHRSHAITTDLYGHVLPAGQTRVANMWDGYLDGGHVEQ